MSGDLTRAAGAFQHAAAAGAFQHAAAAPRQIGSR
jgi:hypothetical protein